MALTRVRVVDVATSILREFGLGDLSMRRLARELDVAPGAIYWHIANKQVLLAAVAERLLADVPLGEQGADDPAAALRAHVLAVRDALLPVPDGADVVAIAYTLDPDSVPALREIGVLLKEAGAQDVAASTDLVVHHILGSVAATQVRAASPEEAVSSPDRFEPALDILLGLSCG
ncbi:TetR family transcriptional regulator [Epidermidibacterium keratini]|uniref:TetR family transcriptional regulator n=1 Tax=Epidermidibacterium keratini TaxID=1891644 RepID=A0A7L4YQN8_9ACTN|nr:TetR family transcriptional regulator [Epidermidibacterium keratini]QHC01253.1 TetR family transcriptional regulator [Epidermidibacterium keratini]